MANISQREKRKNPLIVIVGPTASGKSKLAVKLAKKFKGEVISADSRQVYTGLDIGTAKITKKEMAGIPHHLLDVASPRARFTAVRYQKLALRAIKAIYKKGQLPVLVGGSPFYIYAVVDGLLFPAVKPDYALRRRLEKLSTAQLFVKLKKLDPERAKTIERQNRRRLIRALEIILKTKKPIPALKKKPLPYSVLFLGIKRSPHELKARIAKRFQQMLRKGLIGEVQKLRKTGLSWKRISEFGFEYKYPGLYLRDRISKQEMKEKILKETLDFARRQMTWFKKDKRIHWIKSNREAQAPIKKFLAIA